VLSLLCLLGGTRQVCAHGFGQRSDLPVPLWLYVTGAAATVALSFVVVGLWMRQAPHLHTYPRLNLLRFRLGRLLAHPRLLAVWRLLAVCLYVLLIVAGLFGTLDPTRNLAPTLIWVIWWVGLAYASALVGNLWAVINPLATLYTWGEVLYRRLTAGGELSRHWRYPPALGVWPGVVLFWLFAWIELVYDNSSVPSHLAGFTLLYSALTWLGMFLFGQEIWLRHGEAFALVFSAAGTVFAHGSTRAGPGGVPGVPKRLPGSRRGVYRLLRLFSSSPSGSTRVEPAPVGSGTGTT
jgi:hypothetical protein